MFFLKVVVSLNDLADATLWVTVVRDKIDDRLI